MIHSTLRVCRFVELPHPVVYYFALIFPQISTTSMSLVLFLVHNNISFAMQTAIPNNNDVPDPFLKYKNWPARLYLCIQLSCIQCIWNGYAANFPNGIVIVRAWWLCHLIMYVLCTGSKVFGWFLYLCKVSSNAPLTFWLSTSMFIKLKSYSTTWRDWVLYIQLLSLYMFIQQRKFYLRKISLYVSCALPAQVPAQVIKSFYFN